MSGPHGLLSVAAIIVALFATSLAVAQTTPDPPPPVAPQAPPPNTPGSRGSETPSITIIPSQLVQAILGQEVRSSADENMGRIVDVIVDAEGHIRAAIIDFGGFLGVGSRKIAVEWKALRFIPTAARRYRISLELTRDQVKAAPEYKEGKPVVALGASGSLEPLP